MNEVGFVIFQGWNMFHTLLVGEQLGTVEFFETSLPFKKKHFSLVNTTLYN